ncbi:hypothetical protein J2T10_001863 [Paenarthrobacter nicotinovorans]|uniref:Uncharacterized protein n=1 Tax=Paenarthrobacter nicotinovorans TaxID=29320 RepID=A0ABT9TKP8_PAENI|nr:hypothetical protein [Paenarthrobacter nicotinovorans]
MTARRAPNATTPVTASAELVGVPTEALANETAAAESIAQDVQAPADEVADAIAELEAEANTTRKAPAKKPEPAKKALVRTTHADCTQAKSGAEGKRPVPLAAANVPKPLRMRKHDPRSNDRRRRLRACVLRP